jgi:hypothetical protein
MHKIYWTDIKGQEHSLFRTELGEALNVAKYARDAGGTFVVIASENPDQVGKKGVDSIKEGVLPDGNMYEWKKRRI